MRTDNEREQQIRDQTIYISHLEESIEKMRTDLNSVQQALANNQ